MDNFNFMIPMARDKETGLYRRDPFSEMLQGGIDPEAFYQVGYAMLEGEDKNIPQGLYWMTEAANEGCEKAIRYFDAHPELKPKGAEWHIPTLEDKIAKAEAGDERSIRGLIELYLNGNEEVEPNPQKVIYWEQKLVDFEDPSAYFNMGLFYAKGYGVERDYIKAAEWMEQAAENGDEDGESAARKYRKMAELEKAAKTGDIEAVSAYAVALILDAGSLSQAGREKDDREAIELSKIVAQSGNLKAITDLATEFMRKGNSLENEAAKPLYQAAVELAQKAGDYGDALWVLALAYEHGRGVDEDLDKAIEYYKKGAELGHAPSQHSYGCFFLRGDYLDADKPLGFDWVQKSAQQGYNLALFTLAKLYEAGDGTEKDLDKAIKWGEKAAAQGDADVQCEVAKMYASAGKNGGMYDAKKSRYWFKKAAGQGNSEAERLLHNDELWKKGNNLENFEAAQAKSLKNKAMEIMRSVILEDNGEIRRLLLDPSRQCSEPLQKYSDISFEELCQKGLLLFDMEDVDPETSNICYIVTTAENSEIFGKGEFVLYFDIVVESGNNDLDGYRTRASEICSYLFKSLNGRETSAGRKLYYSTGNESDFIISAVFRETKDGTHRSANNIFEKYARGNRAIFEKLYSNEQLRALMKITSETCEKAYEEGYYLLSNVFESKHKAWVILNREFYEGYPIRLILLSSDKKQMKPMVKLVKQSIQEIKVSATESFEYDSESSESDILELSDKLFGAVFILRDPNASLF